MSVAPRLNRGLSNPDRRERFCEGIRLGLTHALAAQYAGIEPRSFYRWMKRGAQEEDGIYREFHDAVKAAEAKGAAHALAAILKSANEGQWTAAAWMLERRHGYVRPEYSSTKAEAEKSDEPRTAEELVDQLAEKVPLKLLEDAIAKARAK